MIVYRPILTLSLYDHFVSRNAESVWSVRDYTDINSKWCIRHNNDSAILEKTYMQVQAAVFTGQADPLEIRNIGLQYPTLATPVVEQIGTSRCVPQIYALIMENQ
jgi:hypothetical protein